MAMLLLLFLCLLPAASQGALVGCSTGGNTGSFNHIVEYILVRFTGEVSFGNYSDDLMSLAFRVTTTDLTNRPLFIKNATLFNSTTIKLDLEPRSTFSDDSFLWQSTYYAGSLYDIGTALIHRQDLESQTGQRFNVSYTPLQSFGSAGLMESSIVAGSVSCVTYDLSPPALSRVFAVTGTKVVYFQFSEPIKPVAPSLGISNFTISPATSFESTTFTPVQASSDGFAWLWTINTVSNDAITHDSFHVITMKTGIVFDRAGNVQTTLYSSKPVKYAVYTPGGPTGGYILYHLNYIEPNSDGFVSQGSTTIYDVNEDGVFDTIKISMPFVFNSSAVNISSFRCLNFVTIGTEVQLTRMTSQQQDPVTDTLVMSMAPTLPIGTRPVSKEGTAGYLTYPQIILADIMASFYSDSVVKKDIFASDTDPENIKPTAADKFMMTLDQAHIVAVSLTSFLGYSNATVVFSESLFYLQYYTLYAIGCSTTFAQPAIAPSTNTYTFSAAAPLKTSDFFNCKFAFASRTRSSPITTSPIDGTEINNNIRVGMFVNPSQRIVWKPIALKSNKTSAPTLLKAEIFSDNTTTWTSLLLTFSEAMFDEILPTIQATATGKTISLSNLNFVSSTQLRYNVSVNCTVSEVQCFATDDSMSIAISGMRDLHANLMTSFNGTPNDKSPPRVRTIAIADQFLFVMLSEECDGTINDADFSLNDTSNTAVDIIWFEDVAVITFSKAIESIVLDQVRFFDTARNFAHYPTKFSASVANSNGTTVIVVEDGGDDNATEIVVTITESCESIDCLSNSLFALVIVAFVLAGLGIIAGIYWLVNSNHDRYKKLVQNL